jgi:hypothetical protein
MTLINFTFQVIRKNLKLKTNKMNTKTKKPVMKAEPIQTEKKKSTKKVAKKAESIDLNKVIHAKMTNLETAYMAAVSGKIKFGEVKSVFKKLHKEIKESRKK